MEWTTLKNGLYHYVALSELLEHEKLDSCSDSFLLDRHYPRQDQVRGATDESRSPVMSSAGRHGHVGLRGVDEATKTNVKSSASLEMDVSKLFGDVREALRLVWKEKGSEIQRCDRSTSGYPVILNHFKAPRLLKSLLLWFASPSVGKCSVPRLVVLVVLSCCDLPRLLSC